MSSKVEFNTAEKITNYTALPDTLLIARTTNVEYV